MVPANVYPLFIMNLKTHFKAKNRSGTRNGFTLLCCGLVTLHIFL